jgi:hypothetical protein
VDGDFSLNGKRFVPVQNSGNGEVDASTVFIYHEENGIVWGEYAGGSVLRGYLLGTRISIQQVDFVYMQLNAGFQVRTGSNSSRLELRGDGKLRLHESWQWTSQDRSTGTSIVEEV